VGFAHARKAEKDNVFGVVQKPHGTQLIDLALVYGRLEAVIEYLHDICIILNRPFEIVIQYLKGVFHFQTFKVLPQPLVGKFAHNATSS
jgi:hypothetical protein